MYYPHISLFLLEDKYSLSLFMLFALNWLSK